MTRTTFSRGGDRFLAVRPDKRLGAVEMDGSPCRCPVSTSRGVLRGGKGGAVGRNSLMRAGSDAWEALTGRCGFTVQPGDRLMLESPGGGGFGPQPSDPPVQFPSS